MSELPTETSSTIFRCPKGKEIQVSILDDSKLHLLRYGRRHRRRKSLEIPMENILGTDSKRSIQREASEDSIQTISNGDEVPEDSRLLIHFVEKSTKKWTLSKVELLHTDKKLIASLKERVWDFIGSINRPKRLLFYVNPFGGKRKAEIIFEKTVKPLLEIAGVQYDMELTLRRNHALDSIQNRSDLENDFDGVVSVGGDGMFSEVFNGVLRRGGHSNRTNIRVGIIPAGSTDALALSLHGTRDVLTCVLHILLGDGRNVDLTAIYTEDHEGMYILDRYSMAMASYGYFGDLLKRSEDYRWMGPKRYDYCGFRTFLANQSYGGTLTFVGREENYSNSALCSESCRVCENTAKMDSGSKMIGQSITGRFMAITAATLTCACEKTPNGISPFSHLGDGYSDVIIVDRCSRFQYFKYLIRTGFKNTPSPFNLPFVRTFKVREMTFQPSEVKTSVWNCDGELIHNPNIRLIVHCQILPVFARGIVSKNVKPRKKLSFCPWGFTKRRRQEQDRSSFVSVN